MRFFLPLLIFLHSGCAFYTTPKAARLYLAGRYSDVESFVEGKMEKGASISHEERSYLCASYGHLKKYGEMFACGGEMEEDIKREKPRQSWLWDTTYAHWWATSFAYIELGDYAQAIDWGRRAVEEVPREHNDPFHQTYALSALALAHALHGEKAKALEYAARLEKVGTLDFRYRSLQTEKLMELAKIYIALGEFHEARAAMERAEKGEPSRSWKFFSNLFVGASFTGGSLYEYQKLPKAFMRAKTLFETGDAEEAKRRYDWLLAQPRTVENGDIYWMILFDRGRIAEREGDAKQAIEFYEKAVAVIERARSTIHTEASKIGFIGDKQEVYHRLIAALFSDAREGKAFEYVERSKSRALVDLLASKKEFTIRQGDEREIRAILDRLEALEEKGRIQETKRTQAPGATRSLAMDARAELREKAPELASLVTVSGVSWEEIAGGLAPDETLVEYYHQGDELYAFVLARGTIRGVKLEGQGLAREVQAFRAAVEERASGPAGELSSALFARLIEPLEPGLTAGNIVIVPHGVLHYLPFAALKKGEKDCLSRYAIRYLPSASVTLFLRRGRSGSARVMAVGNPEYGDAKPSLAFAEREAQAVARVFSESSLVTGKEATETVFKKTGGAFRVLHVATHGLFRPENPLDSSLLLARDHENDGRLTAGELYALSLDADLVTLSACDTGLSAIANGDDLVGLTRGFLYAGARAVIASLWSVDDEATAFLMERFYVHLRAGRNKRDALREAQLEARGKYPDPFYWAAFQLTGAV